MQQISVPLPDDVLSFVQRDAERECRTVAGQVRYLLTEAARRAGHKPGAPELEEWPPWLPVVTPANLAEVKQQIEGWQGEFDALNKLESEPRRNGAKLELTIPEENRRGWLRVAIANVEGQVRLIEGRKA